jgi:uncharacterized membrane protein
MNENSATPGWKNDPSRWSRRLLLVALALAGLGIATYLTLYQTGGIQQVWEPFFGEGSHKVLHSVISRMLPVPDAALGALAYFVEIVAGVIGGRDRWRTLPWLVIFYGATAMAMGLTGILLVIFQAVWVQAWCTLCLVSAGLSLAIAALAREELLATLRFVGHARDRGDSPWHSFWGMAR